MEVSPLLTTKIKLNWMFSAQSIIFKQNECSTAAKPKYTFAFPPWLSQNGKEDLRCQHSVKIYLLRISKHGSQKQFIFNQHRFFLPLDVSVLPHSFRWIFTSMQVVVCLNLTNIELSRKNIQCVTSFHSIGKSYLCLRLLLEIQISGHKLGRRDLAGTTENINWSWKGQDIH